MNKSIKLFIGFLFFVAVLGACSSSSDEKLQTELVVSTASSLRQPMEEIQRTYELYNPRIKLQLNFGGSGSLQQQISQGAPVDLFFSAAVEKVDLLVKDGLIEKDEVIELLGNELVLIVPNENDSSIRSFSDLEKKEVDKISIGIPETVPAGKYAKETLDNIDMWKYIEHKIVFAKDVRQVLSYVETGNVSAGIVYKTDVIDTDKVKIIDSAEVENHSPIVYPLGIMKDTVHYEEAKEFYDYLQSEEGLKVFRDYGFNTN